LRMVRIFCCTVISIAVASTMHSSARAQAAAPPIDPQVATILDRLADPMSPGGYTAAVKLHVKLRVFPFISMTLNGTTTYQRPGIYEFSFHGFPLVARQFEKMGFDLGDPRAWPQQYDIARLADAGNGDCMLRLTPRASRVTRYIDITVDPAKGHILRARWSRYDNGTLALTEQYTAVGSSEMVSTAQAQVAIGAIRATLSMEFGDFVVQMVAAKESDGS
jgi:hypothetical protein